MAREPPDTLDMDATMAKIVVEKNAKILKLYEEKAQLECDLIEAISSVKEWKTELAALVTSLPQEARDQYLDKRRQQREIFNALYSLPGEL